MNNLDQALKNMMKNKSTLIFYQTVLFQNLKKMLESAGIGVSWLNFIVIFKWLKPKYPKENILSYHQPKKYFWGHKIYEKNNKT